MEGQGSSVEQTAVSPVDNGPYGDPPEHGEEMYLRSRASRVHNPELDPNLPHSTHFAEALENNCVVNRDRIVFEKFIMTPMNALREMAKEFEQNVHYEYNELHIGAYKIYVVEVFAGHVFGFGECKRRKVAAQMAAADVLVQIQEVYPDVEIPPYGLLPGCRINPQIFVTLKEICAAMGAEFPIYYRGANLPDNNPLFVFVCRVGGLVRSGESDSPVLAKRLAAFHMFEALVGEKYKMDRVCKGIACKDTLDRYGVKGPETPLKLQAISEKKEYVTGLVAEAKACGVANAEFEKIPFCDGDEFLEDLDINEPETLVPNAYNPWTTMKQIKMLRGINYGMQKLSLIGSAKGAGKGAGAPEGMDE